MIRNRNFVFRQPLPFWFVNRLQDRLSALENLRLTIASPTTIEAPVAADARSQTTNVQGKWRFNEATVSTAHPGGTAGTYDVFVVAAADSISSSPGPSQDSTDYAFGLRIVAAGSTPSATAATALQRRTHTVAWDGTKITSLKSIDGLVSSQIGDGQVLQRHFADTGITHMVGATGEPGFGPGWHNRVQGLHLAPARFWKDITGRVYLAGGAESNSINSGAPDSYRVFTLPEGFRPAQYVRSASNYDGDIGDVEILTTGEVLVGGGGLVSLDDVNFDLLR